MLGLETLSYTPLARRGREAAVMLASLLACSAGGDAGGETDANETDANETGTAGSTGGAGVTGSEVDGSGDGGGLPDVGPAPYRDEWTVVIDQPFSTYAPDGSIAISSISIGNVEGFNFSNRGDVIVRFIDTDSIRVEMRRFAMAESAADAVEEFDKLSVVASTAPFPDAPYVFDPQSDCVDPSGQAPWRDGCRVGVFYDDNQQPLRMGADLRVSLPRDFIFDLSIETEDNDADADYQNRGNVCVEGLRGSTDIQLSNGSAWVILDEGAVEMAECPDPDRQACEASSWDVTCPCMAQGYAFGQVKVASIPGQASNATVDVPNDGFWVAYNMRNEGDNTAGDDAPGALCEATVDESAGELLLTGGTDLESFPFVNQGTINYPGEPATLGAGYGVQLVSDACALVFSTERPGSYVGAGNGATQQTSERGNLRICAGCARSEACEGLVPD